MSRASLIAESFASLEDASAGMPRYSDRTLLRAGAHAAAPMRPSHRLLYCIRINMDERCQSVGLAFHEVLPGSCPAATHCYFWREPPRACDVCDSWLGRSFDVAAEVSVHV